MFLASKLGIGRVSEIMGASISVCVSLFKLVLLNMLESFRMQYPSVDIQDQKTPMLCVVLY